MPRCLLTHDSSAARKPCSSLFVWSRLRYDVSETERDTQIAHGDFLRLCACSNTMAHTPVCSYHVGEHERVVERSRYGRGGRRYGSSHEALIAVSQRRNIPLTLMLRAAPSRKHGKKAGLRKVPGVEALKPTRRPEYKRAS